MNLLHRPDLFAVFIDDQDVPAAVGQRIILGDHQEPAQPGRCTRDRAVELAEVFDRDAGQGIARQDKEAILTAQHIQSPRVIMDRRASERAAEVDRRLELAGLQGDQQDLAPGKDLNQLVAQDQRWVLDRSLEIEPPFQGSGQHIEPNQVVMAGIESQNGSGLQRRPEARTAKPDRAEHAIMELRSAHRSRSRNRRPERRRPAPDPWLSTRIRRPTGGSDSSAARADRVEGRRPRRDATDPPSQRGGSARWPPSSA